MESKIDVGSEVRVNFYGAQTTLCHRAVVKRVPCATGDSWVFEDATTKDIHYVSEGCTITLLSKPIKR